MRRPLGLWRSSVDRALERVRRSRPGWVEDSWWLAMIPQPNLPDLDTTALVRLANPRGCFLADPIPLVGSVDEYLVEQYRFADRKGVISHLKVAPDGDIELSQAIIEEDFHLSFPVSFEHDGRTFVVAEAQRGGSTFLWEYMRDDRASRRVGTIIDEPLRDIAIFRVDGRWHLLATSTIPDWRMVHYAADSPTGEWTEAPIDNETQQFRLGGVPVFAGPVDGQSEAGHEAWLPLQGNSRGYGSELAIALLEVPPRGAMTVRPRSTVYPPGPFIGLHSLAVGATTTLVDLKHLRLRPDQMVRRFTPSRIVAKLRRTFARAK